MTADLHDASAVGAIDERPWVVATRIALAIVGAIALVLVVTGVMLVFSYRPDVPASLAKAQGIPSHSNVRTVHGDAARLLFPAFGCLAIVAGGLALVRRRVLRVVPVVIAGLAVLAATLTGYLLPWDQLALFRVSVGTNVSGYRMILFEHSIRYVVVGDDAVGTATIARWFWVHVAVTALLFIVPVIVIARQTRAAKRGG